MGEFVSTLGNPWLLTEWNMTRQGEFFKKYGAKRAQQFQEAAQRVNAQQQAGRPVVKVITIIKKIGDTNTSSGGGHGGGLVGAGSSGEGPPV